MALKLAIIGMDLSHLRLPHLRSKYRIKCPGLSRGSYLKPHAYINPAIVKCSLLDSCMRQSKCRIYCDIDSRIPTCDKAVLLLS